MLWNLVAIWALVLSVITWFIRDEAQRRRQIPLRRLASLTSHTSAQPDQHPARSEAVRRKLVRSMLRKID